MAQRREAWETDFRISGTSLCACTCCLNMPGNLPKTQPAIPLISVYDSPLLRPPNCTCRVSLSVFPLFLHHIRFPPGLTGFTIVPRVPSPILSPRATLQGQAFMLTQLDDCNSSILFLTKPPTSTTWTTAAIIFSLFKIFPRVPRSYTNSLVWHFSMPTPNSLLWQFYVTSNYFSSPIHCLSHPTSISFKHCPSSGCIIKSRFFP